ncbi:unnamed protein product [Arabidopsis lyrata]|uniref:Expressed protein n=1 Tax=Arabidopsis lyrata subsp. lyrata TaxID=81972 RepID=D7L451_ARALL|nr:expressed protein [Arabidopsis lyrata subsp. lyrata]CAH8261608.1 unnamed protein product [Arabidopsis lyrata]
MAFALSFPTEREAGCHQTRRATVVIGRDGEEDPPANVHGGEEKIDKSANEKVRERTGKKDSVAAAATMVDEKLMVAMTLRSVTDL